jgi:cell division protein FtsB
MESSIELLVIVLFIWFWISCFIFKYLSDKIITLDKTVKRLDILNNELSNECIELEESNKELLNANYILTSKN